MEPSQEEIMQERHAAIKPLLDVLAAHGEFVPMPNDLVMVINSYISPVFAFPATFQAPQAQPAPAQAKLKRLAPEQPGPDRDVLTSMRTAQKHGHATAAFQAVMVEKFIHRAMGSNPKAGRRINARGWFTYTLGDMMLENNLTKIQARWMVDKVELDEG